jgi:acyl-CoA thioester hydrolase
MESTLTNYPQAGSFKGSFPVQIFYEDTDFTGYVYHSNYLKYFERAREMVLGVDMLKELYKEGVHFVVAEANLKYRAAARFGDHITIETTVTYEKSPLVQFKQLATLDGKTLVDGDISLATVNEEGRPIRLPDAILKEFSLKL